MPFAALDRTGNAVDTGGAQRADRITVPEAVAVNELLDSRLVRSIMTRRPKGMGLVERAVVENLLVHRTGGNEDETIDVGSSGSAICPLSDPPLSSVRPDAEQVGYRAAEVLDAMMDGKPAPTAVEYISPKDVVERMSTRGA